jgi:hypothetical protein
MFYDKEHRVGGPSFVNTGYTLPLKDWRRDSFYHRLNAPARIDGYLEHPEFWQFGIKIT